MHQLVDALCGVGSIAKSLIDWIDQGVCVVLGLYGLCEFSAFRGLVNFFALEMDFGCDGSGGVS